MNRFFPWRLFWKFFGIIFFILNFVVIFSMALASYLIDFSFFNQKTYLVLFFHLAISILCSFFFAWKFASPMKSAIMMALKIANRRMYSEVSDDFEDVLVEEPGEYFELEEALRKIQKKMKRRKIQLAHEREESQALFSSLEDAVFSIDLEEKVRFYNSRFVNQFLNKDQRSIVLRRGLLSLREIFRSPELLNATEDVLQSSLSQSIEIELESEIDKEKRQYNLRLTPLIDQKKLQIYGVLGLFHDITEIKKMENLRKEFVENASHELRTPLTSIKGYLETSRDDLSAGNLQHLPKFLEIISKNVNRLQFLVDDMMTLVTLEGGQNINKEEINLIKLTEDTLEKVMSLAVEKGIRIQYQCEVKTFWADPIKIEQVLTNLIENAIKYIQPGKEIQVRWLMSQREKGSEVILQVSDNGPGISEEHLHRLFERFYRIDKGRSRDAGGTGLGLSIVKHIVQGHGGQIQVESQLGEGTAFVCRFPIYR